MKKLLIIISVIFYFTPLISQDVSVGMIVPSSANQGQEFEISITVNKADVTGFARLQLDLPLGFTVKASQTMGSTFSFKDNKIRFLWMSLPADRTLNVSCLATADASVSGDVTIEGSFSYVLNNETQRFSIPAQVVSFGGASVAVNNNAAEEEAARLERERQERLEKERVEHDSLAREQAEREAQEAAERLAQQYTETQTTDVEDNNNVEQDLKSTTQDLSSNSETIDIEPPETTPETTPETRPETTPEITPEITPSTSTSSSSTSTYSTTSPTSSSTSSNYSTASTTSTRKGAVEYKVQVGAFKSMPAQGYFKKLENSITEHILVKSNDSDGFMRYYIGSFDNFTSVDNFHKRVMQLGYSSFIVANKDGSRITIKQAKEISGN